MPEKPTSQQPWFAVTLVVRSTSTLLETVTMCVGRSPTSTHERGDLVSERNPESPRRAENVWRLEASNLALESLSDVVEEFLGSVATTSTLPDDCTIELRIGLTARPMGHLVDLSSAVVRRLAELGASVILDVYDSDQS